MADQLISIIDILYSFVGIVIAAGYLPQITKLIKTTLPCHDISLLAWSIWAYTASISLLYSLFCQETLDLKFVFANLINAICIALIIGITLYKRKKYGKTGTTARPETAE